jgi:hypothetical protein
MKVHPIMGGVGGKAGLPKLEEEEEDEEVEPQMDADEDERRSAISVSPPLEGLFLQFEGGKLIAVLSEASRPVEF